jgi:phosphatidylserine synthase
MTMAEAVYVLCALTSLFCAGLLIRSYRARRTRLLLWSSACFIGLALNNALLVIDLMVVPQIDLSVVRTAVAAVAMFLLLVGLIWESR